ncbi:MAG: hypothetical protein JO286_25120 [Solirubrobacterales bacterium]|nr:hypothetical protein [Solirubrobacterales bacterium]
MSPVLDRRSRPVRELRISVTDRCNFRCTHCMPKEIFGRDFAFLPHAELLTFEEITGVERAFAQEGNLCPFLRAARPDRRSTRRSESNDDAAVTSLCCCKFAAV